MKEKTIRREIILTHQPYEEYSVEYSRGLGVSRGSLPPSPQYLQCGSV